MNGLRQLMTCHFHEDWRCEYPTVVEAVRHFLDLEGPTVVRDAVQRLDLLLTSLDDDGLRREIEFLGCAVAPESGGVSVRQ